jgi:hypothetical protein
MTRPLHTPYGGRLPTVAMRHAGVILAKSVGTNLVYCGWALDEQFGRVKSCEKAQDGCRS